MTESPPSPDRDEKKSSRKPVIFATAATTFFLLWAVVLIAFVSVAYRDAIRTEALFSRSRTGRGEAIFLISPGLRDPHITLYVRDPGAKNGNSAIRASWEYSANRVFQDAAWSHDGSMVVLRARQDHILAAHDETTNSSRILAAYDFQQHKNYRGSREDPGLPWRQPPGVADLLRRHGGLDEGRLMHPQGSNRRALSPLESEEIRRADRTASERR